MPKIIKKKFRESLPIFLILSLLSLSVSGLVFNFNIVIEKVGDKIGLSVEVSEVEAQSNDTATTTVTVRNAAPYFTVDPAENPASASTTPVNVGSSINFIATADDAESNDYYLLVCDQDGATAGAGGSAPSCDNTTFCVSTSTTAGTQSNCTYGSVADPVPSAETEDWVAYVCDNHPDEAACVATSNTGTGDSGSPFYVNHAPVFTAVGTVVDNQVPGGIFSFNATTTDSDTEGGADVLSVDICDTDSWTVGGGCDSTTLCTGTSTSPNVGCSWTSGVPLADQSYNYYAFVKDWHDFEAGGNSQTSSYTVANDTPSVSSILLNGGSDITLNIKGAPEVEVSASSTSITDPNGCNDIISATGTVYWSGATGGASCAADDNDCYPMTGVECSIDSSTCTGPSDSDVTIRCSTNLAYYAIPTSGDGTDGNPNDGTNWLASIRAFDEALSYASTSPGVELNSATAIEVNEAEIAYGTLVAGENTGSDNATTTIVNAGNAPLDTNLIGEDMLRDGTGPEKIPASQQEFDLANFTYGGATYTLASSSQTLLDISAPRPDSAADVADDVYWGIGVPVILSGDYDGLNTFTAQLDDDVGGEW